MSPIFRDQEFSRQFIGVISHSVYSGVDIGECFKAASMITDGDFDSWYTEWLKTADRARSVADESLVTGHAVSAREAYLRASSYYRAAGIFLYRDPKDPRIIYIRSKSRQCFYEAGQLASPNFESVEIPYEKTVLSGYFWRVDASRRRRPTLLLCGGLYGVPEELYFPAVGALRRGYNCLAFAGAGQEPAAERQKIFFRQDGEQVIEPVMNFVLDIDEVDRRRIGIAGLGLGAYLALQTVAFETRISACIASVQELGPNPEVFNAQERPAAQNDLWPLLSIKRIAGQITCPTLVRVGEEERDLTDQAKRLYALLKCKKKLLASSVDEGTGLLSSQRIYDWLDTVVGLTEQKRAA